MRKGISRFVIASLVAVLFLAAIAIKPNNVDAASTGGWHLIETKYHISSSDVTIKGAIKSRVMGTTEGYLLDTYTAEGSEGDMTFTHSRVYNNGDPVAHITHQVVWDTPSAYLAPNQKTGFNLEAKTVSSNGWSQPAVYANFDAGDINPGSVTSSYIEFDAKEGETSIREIRDRKAYLESRKEIPEGRPGDKKRIILNLGHRYGYTYTYEWKEGVPPTDTTSTAPTAPTGSGAEAFESGSRIMWQPATGLGYRLFRSTSQSSLGISVTDFFITSTSYADVNVEPNTTYYYTVKPVLAEARPLEGIEEKLGSAIAAFTVKTGSVVYKPGSFKHFIMLKLESPYMSVDGISQEVDPGRGTAPVIIAGRTMVPIRAVVEAMGGTVDWDQSTQKITLKARGNTVVMWLGKTDITVNGVSKKMDIAPTTKNSRTFVPVRFAAENLSCKVDWINSTQEAVIVYEE